MTPPTATASRRPAQRSPARRMTVPRRRRARRRRVLLTLVLVASVAIGVVAVLPLFRRAVTELALPLAYQDVIRAQAADKHLDPAFVAAVIYAESKFDPRTSAAGAVGLMQIEPATAQFLAHRSGATSFHVSDLWTPAVNIAYGSYYLRYLLDQYGQSKVLALAAYNGGETNVNRWEAAARARGGRLTISAIPFPETRAYVSRVLSAQHDYRRTYPTELGYR